MNEAGGGSGRKGTINLYDLDGLGQNEGVPH